MLSRIQVPPEVGDWNNEYISEYFFDDYVEAGFNTVRVPIRWDKHTLVDSPYTVSETWLDTVEQVIDWGLSKDLYLIINAHHDWWLVNNYDSTKVRDRFHAIWNQISNRFKTKSPKLLFEIIIGMSVRYLSNKKCFEKGIWLASDPVLKLGVSFLGFRLSLENITQLGGVSLFLIFILIFITILFGYFFSLVLLKNKDFGLLSAGSVAICGASAAIAIFSILPKNKLGTKDLSLVIISVTLLSLSLIHI